MRIVLRRIDQCPFDRLLDPVAGVRAEARAHRRIEAFHGTQQAEVAFFDQILQPQPFAGVAAGDIHHQPQVGAHHAIAGFHVALADGDGQLLLLGGVEQGGFVDFAQIRFERRLNGRRRAASRGWHKSSTGLSRVRRYTLHYRLAALTRCKHRPK